MPLAITCPCGHKFAAKDDARGKAVRCPECGKGLRIPKADGLGRGTSLVRCVCGKVLKVTGSVDGVGLKCPACGEPIRVQRGSAARPSEPGASDPRAQPCPVCGLPVEPASGVCLHCGTNIAIVQQVTALDPLVEESRKKRTVAIMIAVAAVLAIVALIVRSC